MCQSIMIIRKLTILISLIGLLFLTNSCNDSDSIEPELPNFWTEHHKVAWDSTSTANNLIGTWKLTYRYCCPESTTRGTTQNVEDENFQLSISAEKISVFIDGELEQESSWSIGIQDIEPFGISAEPSVANTFGRILFAEDMILFNGSYIDGPDNLFERVTKNKAHNSR